MNIRLRDRHRITWYVWILMLPFILALAFVLRPDEQTELSTASKLICETELWKSPAARYTMCDEVLYVRLNNNIRLPVLEIQVISRNKILASKRFEQSNVVEMDLSEYAYEGTTVRLKEVVRDSIIDELKLARHE